MEDALPKFARCCCLFTDSLLGLRLIPPPGHGNYKRLDVNFAKLPPLWLAFVADPSDSGRMHSNVRQLWLDNDPTVHEAMRKFADYTSQGEQALLKQDYDTFMELMDKNFDLRRELYGEPALGDANLQACSILLLLCRCRMNSQRQSPHAHAHIHCVSACMHGGVAFR